jgi:hypothetical protein
MAQFNIAWRRVREIASLVIVRHGRLPDMDDRVIYLECAVTLSANFSKKIPGAIGVATGAKGVIFDNHHLIQPVVRLQA